MKNHNEATLKELLALFCKDVDIFLLKDEAQENDLDKMYSKEEIREQLHKTIRKFAKLPNIHPLVWDVPLFPALIDLALLESGFSKSELESITRQLESEKQS
tara:strand:+ start:2331 stop:2636 length:306 start_codon:yes stop_codon:yes gene_type:complete